MPEVIVRKASYDYEVLRPVFFEIMDSLGGGGIRKNSRIVIKPNLLAPAPPSSAIVTHPLVVRAAVEYVLERQALPVISDSPAMGSFEKVLKASGMKDALKGLDVECREFKKAVPVSTGAPFHTVHIAEDALNAAAMINLPKLKTHSQMLLTLGVKNLFGCIVGMNKPEWHFRTGIDREMFARLLVQIYGAVKPSFTVLDGILAMEGQGPGRSGTAREIGVLLGSNNAVALDAVVCGMLGIMPEELLTCKAAAENGFRGDSVVDGEVPLVRDFKFPVIGSLVFGPKLFHGMLRRHFVQRPDTGTATCKLCGECWKYCPAGAIKRRDGRIHFDYDKCIRCYCCIEVCPQGALRAVETLPGKLARTIMKRNKG